MDTVRFKTGDVILSEGEDDDSAYLIVNSSVEVVIGEGTKARTVATLGDGDVFGEMCLIEPGPRSATVRAATNTACAVMTYDDFVASMRDNPELAMEFMKTLVLRLRKMNEMMENLDPGNRSLLGVCRDWLAALDTAGEDLSDEERERRLSATAQVVPNF